MQRQIAPKQAMMRVRGRADRTVRQCERSGRARFLRPGEHRGRRCYSATEERDISFHQVRRSDGSCIRYRQARGRRRGSRPQRYRKGYSLPSGDTIVLTGRGSRRPPAAPCTRVVDVLQFVPAEQVDPDLLPREATTWSRKTRRSSRICCWREALDESGMYRIGQGGNPKPGAAGDAAGARRCDRAGDDDLAGRGTGSRVFRSWTSMSTCDRESSRWRSPLSRAWRGDF